jgi:hypothetical protein
MAEENGAIPYDIPGVELTHVGELCSFDAFIKKYRPQSAGLYAISLGLSATFPDDHQMLRHGLVMYDALYAWCKSLQHETHRWPPAKVSLAS